MLSVGLVLESEREIFRLRALAQERFQIQVAMHAGSVLEAMTSARSRRVGIWIVGMADTSDWKLLVPDAAARPLPLVLLCEGTDAQIGTALENGVSAIVCPDDSAVELAAAVHAASRRELFISPGLLRRLEDRLTKILAAPLDQRREVLTDREKLVLSLMARGMSNIAIGADLHISPTTVSTHVGNILHKLGAANRAAAVALAYELLLITPSHGGRSSEAV